MLSVPHLRHVSSIVQCGGKIFLPLPVSLLSKLKTQVKEQGVRLKRNKAAVTHTRVPGASVKQTWKLRVQYGHSTLEHRRRHFISIGEELTHYLRKINRDKPNLNVLQEP